MHVREGGAQKRGKLALGHLAGGHSELFVFDPPTAADVSLDFNIVGWVRYDELHQLTLKQELITGCLQGVTTYQTVIAQHP
jgi:hypothetical protein